MDKYTEKASKSNREPENESNDNETPPQKKMCTQRKTNRPSWTYKFDESWLKMPIFMGWLEEAADDEPHSSKTEIYNKFSFCKICKIRILSRESVLRNHAEKLEHKQNAAKAAENVNIISLLPTTPLTKNVRRAELKLSGLVATNDLPLSLMDSLIPLIRDILPDSEIAKNLTLNKTKCTTVMTEILGKLFLEKLYSKLREPGCFFALIASKLIDGSVNKQCAFAVRYYDTVKCNIVVNFFDIVETEWGKSSELFNALKKSLVDKNIPLSNLVAFSSDSITAVLVGNNSVATLLKNEVPNLLCVKCSCHMTNAALSHASLKLPKSIEGLVRDIGIQLSRSPHRSDQLRTFQLFFKTDAYKRSFLNIPCWLSIKYFVDIIVQQFQPLKAYITDLEYKESSVTTVEMLSTMNDQFTKIYLEFLSYIHSLMTGFDTLFQSNKPLLHKVKPETARLLKTICSNFMNIEAIRKNDIFKLNHKEPDNFVKLEHMYIGIAAHESFRLLASNSELEETCNKFLNKILEFYIDLVSSIKESFVFDDPVCDLLLLIEPKFAQSFQETSLKGIIDYFPILNKVITMQKLDNEWRHHALLDFKELNLDSITDTEDYWKKIFQMKNALGEELFPNLKKVVCFLFILTYSNACEVGIFKDISKIKSNKRNVLDISLLKAIVASKQGIDQSGGCIQFEPESDMIDSNIWNEKYE